MSSSGGYQRVPPVPPSGIDQTATGDVTFPAGATFPAAVTLPNSATTGGANYIQLGPATTAGIRIVRNGSAQIQFIVGDASANARAACATFVSTNYNGPSTPNVMATYATNYGLDIPSTGPYAQLVGGGNIGVRVNAQGQTNIKVSALNKTGSGQSVVITDTGSTVDNANATGVTTVTLPDSSLNPRGCIYTFVNLGGGATWMKVQVAANATDRFGFNGTLGAVGGYMQSTSTYQSLTVAYGSGGVLGLWTPIAMTGTAWTLA